MEKNIATLQNGGIGVIATDTIYGIVGQALNRTTTERIYKVKKRTPMKPFIILISSLVDLESFNVTINEQTKLILDNYWPGPVSIILDCQSDDFEYLHRGTNTLAFRIPAKSELIDIITQTGPLVAPSANPEGLEPAADITAARTYFGESVDFYIEGIVNTKPSRIVKITSQGEEIIRP